MFTGVHACVSVFAELDSVLSVGGGILFVFMKSAAAWSHDPASTESVRFFDSCAQTVSLSCV